MKKRLHVFGLAVSALLGAASVTAQAQESQPALFTYPQAPDTCSSLESRSNYVLQHFWDTFDFGKPITDDRALVKTFRDYADMFKYGHRNVVMASVRDFMFKLRVNSANLSKVGQVAEMVLYGPMADFWSDEVYVEFAKSLASATVLQKEEREYYSRQIALIGLCQEGAPLQLEFIDATTGGKRTIEQTDTVTTLVLFVNDGIDSRTGRTMLDADLTLTQLVEQGNVSVLCIFDGVPSKEWAATLPAAWQKGYAERIEQHIDLRFLPACFLLDAEHRILQKNMSIQDLKEALN